MSILFDPLVEATERLNKLSGTQSARIDSNVIDEIKSIRDMLAKFNSTPVIAYRRFHNPQAIQAASDLKLTVGTTRAFLVHLGEVD
jgi:hypothetical protein